MDTSKLNSIKLNNLIYIKNAGLFLFDLVDDHEKVYIVPASLYLDVSVENTKKALQILKSILSEKVFLPLKPYIKIEKREKTYGVTITDDLQYKFQKVVRIFQPQTRKMFLRQKQFFDKFQKELEKHKVIYFSSFPQIVGLPMFLYESNKTFSLVPSFQIIDIITQNAEVIKTDLKKVDTMNDEIISIAVNHNTQKTYMILNKRYFGSMDPNKIKNILQEFYNLDNETDDKLEIIFQENEQKLLVSFFELLKNLNVNMISGWTQDFDLLYIHKRIMKLRRAPYYYSKFSLFEYYNGKKKLCYQKQDVGDSDELIDILKEVPFLEIEENNSERKVCSFLNVMGYKDLYQKYVMKEPSGWEIEIIQTENDIDLSKMEKFLEKIKNHPDAIWCIRFFEILAVNDFELYKNHTHMFQQMLYYFQTRFKNDTPWQFTFPYKNPNPKLVQYEGAYVQEPPIDKVYKNVIVLDFQSLYPNIIQTFSISFETLFFKNKNEEINVPHVDLQDLLKINEKYIEGKNVCFKFSPKLQLMPRIIKTILDKRKEYKQIFKQTGALDQYNKQLAYKIIQNSIYGAFAYQFFPIFNYVVQQSITAIQRKILKEIMKEVENIKIDSWSFKQLYGDTDSVFIHVYNSENKEDVKINSESEIMNIQMKVKEELQKRIPDIISSLFKNVSREEIMKNCTLEINIDKLFYCIKFFQKKRYYGVLYSGTTYGQESYRGIELQRSDSPKKQKEILREILRRIILNENENIQDLILNYYKKIEVFIQNIQDEKDYLQIQQPNNLKIKNLDEIEKTYKVVPFFQRGFLLAREMFPSLKNINQVYDKVYVIPIKIFRMHPKFQEIKSQIEKYKVQYEEFGNGNIIQVNISILNTEKCLKEFQEQIKHEYIQIDVVSFFDKQILSKLSLQFIEYEKMFEQIRKEILNPLRQQEQYNKILKQFGSLFQTEQ